MLAVAPLVRVPSVNTTELPLVVQVPEFADAERKARPAGSRSVTDTSAAKLGPPFDSDRL